MFLRVFEPEDAETLSRIIIQNLRQVNALDYPREAIEALVPLYTPEKIVDHARHRLTLICTIDKEVVGTASLDLERVRDVFVVLSQHRAGIGRKLMRAIENAAKEQHLKKLFLLAGLSAEEFYKKLGYTVVKRFDNDLNGIPLPVIHMEKELATD